MAEGKLSYTSSVQELRRFVMFEGASFGPLFVGHLVLAAETTLLRNRVLDAYRTACFRTKEGCGDLYTLLGLLYVGDLLSQDFEGMLTSIPGLTREAAQATVKCARSVKAECGAEQVLSAEVSNALGIVMSSEYFRAPSVKDVEIRNPYSSFKSKHGIRQGQQTRLFYELDFLLEEPGIPKRCPDVYDMGKLTETEVASLLNALNGDGILTWLMHPSPYLTHEENLDMRVQHARLWLLKSELPIYIGADCSYADLRTKAEAALSPRLANEQLPSRQQVLLRELTLFFHKSLCDGRILYHSKPSDYPGDDQSDSCNYCRCWANLRYPFLLGPRDGSLQEYLKRFIACCDDPEQDKLEYLEMWRVTETPQMYKQLAKKVVFSVDVEEESCSSRSGCESK